MQPLPSRPELPSRSRRSCRSGWHDSSSRHPAFRSMGSCSVLGALVIVLFVVGVSAATAAWIAARRDREVRVRRATLAAAAAVRVAHRRLSPGSASRSSGERRGVGARRRQLRRAHDRGRGSGRRVDVRRGPYASASTPRLIGWNWDLVLAYPGDGSLGPRRRRTRSRSAMRWRIRARPTSRRERSGRRFPTVAACRSARRERMSAGSCRSTARPRSVRRSSAAGSRRPPTRSCSARARCLRSRLHIGDRIDVYGQAGTWEAPGEETSTRMTVVGTGSRR